MFEKKNNAELKHLETNGFEPGLHQSFQPVRLSAEVWTLANRAFIVFKGS